MVKVTTAQLAHIYKWPNGLYFSFYDEKLFEKMNPNIDHVLLDGLRNIVENI